PRRAGRSRHRRGRLRGGRAPRRARRSRDALPRTDRRGARAPDRRVKRFVALLGKEERAVFFSPIAYALIAVFLLLMGYTFTNVLFLNKLASLSHIFFQMSALFLLLVPIITMRLVAEERKSGTLEVLLPAPVREMEGGAATCAALAGWAAQARGEYCPRRGDAGALGQLSGGPRPLRQAGLGSRVQRIPRPDPVRGCPPRRRSLDLKSDLEPDRGRSDLPRPLLPVVDDRLGRLSPARSVRHCLRQPFYPRPSQPVRPRAGVPLRGGVLPPRLPVRAFPLRPRARAPLSRCTARARSRGGSCCGSSAGWRPSWCCSSSGSGCRCKLVSGASARSSTTARSCWVRWRWWCWPISPSRATRLIST